MKHLIVARSRCFAFNTRSINARTVESKTIPTNRFISRTFDLFATSTLPTHQPHSELPFVSYKHHMPDLIVFPCPFDFPCRLHDLRTCPNSESVVGQDAVQEAQKNSKQTDSTTKKHRISICFDKPLPPRNIPGLGSNMRGKEIPDSDYTEHPTT